jgi:RimJ/RimL family protein N-acetyltransferase
MLEWQRDPSTRQFARESRVPTEREHRRWFQRRLLSETCFLTVIEHDREAAGVLRLDKIDRGMGSPAYEISILVAPEKRRLGIASAALTIARRWVPGIELVAEILPENQASLRLFETASYRPVDGGIFHNIPAAARH